MTNLAINCDEVRAALDTTLDSDMLPDATIGMGIYADAAIAWVLTQDASAESRTGDDLKRVQRATVYYCAALLAPSLPQIVDAKDERLSRRLQERDMAALAGRLHQLANYEIGQVVSKTARPTFFTVASGTRGK